MSTDAQLFALFANAAGLRFGTALMTRQETSGNETEERMSKMWIVRNGTDYSKREMQQTWANGNGLNGQRSWCLAVSEDGELVALVQHRSRVNGENPDYQWREAAKGIDALAYAMDPDSLDQSNADALQDAWHKDLEETTKHYARA